MKDKLGRTPITNVKDWPMTDASQIPSTGGIIPGHKLRELGIIAPFEERTVFQGMTYGAGPAGYDIRVGEDTILHTSGLTLAVSLEHFAMLNWVLGVVHDKSTWARSGLLVQNTIIEPGWHGYLTLEITRHRVGLKPLELIKLPKGTPIAQVIFHVLSEPAEKPYGGKYQNQGNKPVGAKFE